MTRPVFPAPAWDPQAQVRYRAGLDTRFPAA